MKFASLVLGSGAEFSVSHRDRTEAGDGRHQRLLLRGKS